jgi:hypothetical protein
MSDSRILIRSLAFLSLPLAIGLGILVLSNVTAPIPADQQAAVGRAVGQQTTSFFKVGDRVETFVQTSLYGNADAMAVKGAESAGVSGSIVDGPRSHNDDVRYDVRFDDGKEGWASLGTYAYPAPKDTTPPTLTMLSPQNGISVTNTVVVEVAASDNVGVAKVEFFLDGSATPFATVTKAPYRAYVNGLSAGPHTFGARATDTSGNVTNDPNQVTIASPHVVRQGTGVYIQFSFGVTAGHVYDIQKTTSLTDVNWVSQTTQTASSTGVMTYLAPTVGTMGFFRVIDTSDLVPLVSFIQSSYIGAIGNALIIDAQVTNNDFIATTTWDYGDGSPIETYNPPMGYFSRLHTYAALGTYTVRLTATDSNGLSMSTTTSVQVTNPATSVSYFNMYAFGQNDVEGSFANNSANPLPYSLDRATSTSGSYVSVGSGTVAPYTFTQTSDGSAQPTVSAGKTYYYRIKNTSTQAILASTTVTVPSAITKSPSTLHVVRSFPNEIDVAWTNPSQTAYVDSVHLSGNPGNTTKDWASSTAFYAFKNLNPSTSYTFNASYVNPISSSAQSSVSGTTASVSSMADATSTYLIVILNEGGSVALPSALVSTICDQTNPSSTAGAVYQWIKAEANKYSKPSPFMPISCAAQQVSLPSKLFPTSNGNNDSKIISYLETNSAVPAAVQNAVLSAKYVTLLVYVPSSGDLIQDESYSQKYNLVFLAPNGGSSPATATDFIPSLDQLNSSVAQLWAAGLGATVKADPYSGAVNGCAIDTSTGLPYPGQDVMCGWMAMPTAAAGNAGGGQMMLGLPDMIVASTTAHEIGWQ